MSQPAFRDDKPTDDGAEHRDRSPHTLTRAFLLAIGGLFAILLVLALQPEKRFGHGDGHPAVGRSVASLEVMPLVDDATPITLESRRGDVLLVNFWGTWCGPCMIEFPHLVKMNDRLKSEQRFHFIPVACGPGGVDIDASELKAATDAYLAKLETKLDMYSDPGGVARRGLMEAAQLPSFGFPTTVLVGPRGTIQGLWQGYSPGMEAEMEDAINALLKA